MSENLMVGSHKTSNKTYRDNYDRIFGKKAYSKTSKGKFKKGKYRLSQGFIEKGDMVFIDR